MDGYDFEGICEAIHETFWPNGESKALKVRTPKFGEVWIPQSCILDDSEVYEKGQRGKLIVKADYAEDKGWL